MDKYLYATLTFTTGLAAFHIYRLKNCQTGIHEQSLRILRLQRELDRVADINNRLKPDELPKKPDVPL